MAQRFRTPLKATRGLGASGEGAGHFLGQRVSGLALLVLVPWVGASLVLGLEPGFAGARAWLAEPLNAAPVLVLLTVALHHGRLGVQTVVEDYIARARTRVILMTLATFAFVGFWAAGAFAVAKVALGAP